MELKSRIRKQCQTMERNIGKEVFLFQCILKKLKKKDDLIKSVKESINGKRFEEKGKLKY